MKLPNSQRFLVVYSVVLTAVFVATIFLGAKQSSSRKEAFNEIDVQRINIVEPDGTVRMIISDTARAPGQGVSTPRRPQGSRDDLLQ